MQSVFFAALVIATRFVFNRRNDRALIGIVSDIEDFGFVDDFDVVDPAVL